MKQHRAHPGVGEPLVAESKRPADVWHVIWRLVTDSQANLVSLLEPDWCENSQIYDRVRMIYFFD